MEHFFIIPNTLKAHCDCMIFRNNFMIVKSVYGRIKVYSIALDICCFYELGDFTT